MDDEAVEPWSTDPDAWRGEVHRHEWTAPTAPAWPEELAGPEYWMWKREDGGTGQT